MLMRASIAALAVLMLASLAWGQNLAQPDKKTEEGASIVDKQEKGGETADKLVLTGKARMSGTSHFPVLIFKAEDGSKYALGGGYFDELKKLGGLTIKITALPTGKKQQRRDLLDVLDYDILDAGGLKPVLGVLQVREDRIFLKEKSSGMEYELNIKIKKTQEKFRKAAGGRAWVTGPVDGGKIKVKRYKILASVD